MLLRYVDSDEVEIKAWLRSIGIRNLRAITLGYEIKLDPVNYRHVYRLIDISTTDAKDRFILKLYGIEKLSKELERIAVYRDHI